ncbi:MAG: hypothetical protein AB7V50_10365 [Vampirovibrionia bacterium]
MDYTEQVIRLRELIRKKNEAKYNSIKLTKYVVAFRIIIGIAIIAMLVVCINLINKYEPEAMGRYLMIAAGVIFVFLLSVIPRAIQLKKQKDEHGHYLDYRDTPYRSKYRRNRVRIPITDPLAHSLLNMLYPETKIDVPLVHLNDNQLRLAGLILSSTMERPVALTTIVEKEEYLCLEEHEVHHTYKTLEGLDLVTIGNKNGEAMIFQKRNPVSEDIYL